MAFSKVARSLASVGSTTSKSREQHHNELTDNLGSKQRTLQRRIRRGGSRKRILPLPAPEHPQQVQQPQTCTGTAQTYQHQRNEVARSIAPLPSVAASNKPTSPPTGTQTVVPQPSISTPTRTRTAKPTRSILRRSIKSVLRKSIKTNIPHLLGGEIYSEEEETACELYSHNNERHDKENRVIFSDSIVSEVWERPKTDEAEVDKYFYTSTDYEYFRNHLRYAKVYARR